MNENYQAMNEEELRRLINQLIIAHSKEQGHNYQAAPNQYRASSIPYCNRKIALSRQLSEEELLEYPEEEHLVGVSIAGQLIHDFLEKALEPIELSAEEEVRLKIGDFEIIGHYDLLLQVRGIGKIVVDVKTCSDITKVHPKEGHLRQLLFYQAALGEIQGALLYVERNTLQTKLFVQEYNKEEFSKLVLKVAKLHSYMKREELPPPEPEFDYECISGVGKCRFYQYCYGTNNQPMA